MPGSSRFATQETAHGGGVDAELAVGPAGGDLVQGAGIDVGVDAQGHRRFRAALAGDLGQQFQFRKRFDVELHDAGIKPGGHLRRGLADPGKDDALGRNAGGQRAAQFALGDNVGAGAEIGEGLDHRLVGVGLECIADGCRQSRERRRELRYPLSSASAE